MATGQNRAVGELIVVTGPPGAGKPTVASALAGGFKSSALVAGDDFFAFLDRELIPPWRPEAHAQNEVVTQAAAAATGRLADGSYTVVYDGMVGPWFLPTFTAATGLPRLHYVVLMPSEERCVARVQTRVAHAFTDIPATRHMHRQFADAQIDRRHLVIEPSDKPEATAASIRERLANSSLIHHQP